jgi:hypothetical protein
MSKRLFISITIILFTSAVIAQDKVIKKDFNKDGIIDQVSISEDGGSVFSSTEVNYSNGKTRNKYQFSTLYSFGSFFAICNPPNILGKSGREQLVKLLFSNKSASKIDPSLQWLIDACSNREDVKLHELIDFSSKYTPVWFEGSPVIPDDYYVLLENSKYPALLKNVEGSPEYADKKYKSDYFWLAYNPHNHTGKSRGFDTIQVDSVYQILTTSHGVVLKRGLKYSWVFINDDKLFEANEKLRWPSIAEAQMFNGFVLIRQAVNTGTINLFIVNPDSGIVVRLNNELMGLNAIEKMEVDKSKESVELSDSKDNKYQLPMKTITEIFQGLKPQ